MTDAAMPPDLLSDRPVSWPVSATRYVYQGDWVIALREDVVGRPGRPHDRFRRWTLEHPGAVVVLAVDEGERVLCLRQYRHPGGHAFVELPAGLRDADDEDPMVTAQRELQEEAEIAAADWRLLLSTYPSAGLTEEVHEIYLARDLSPADRGDFALEHEEAEMEVFWVPMAGLLDAVLDGRVREGPLVQAVLAYDVLARRGALDGPVGAA